MQLQFCIGLKPLPQSGQGKQRGFSLIEENCSIWSTLLGAGGNSLPTSNMSPAANQSDRSQDVYPLPHTPLKYKIF